MKMLLSWVTAGFCMALAAGVVEMPQIVSHRGESLDRPENTMAAFRLAFARGVDGVECDVYATTDGVPVIIHDATTGRTAGAGTNLTVPASSWNDLKEVRVGAFGKWIGTEWEAETLPRFDDYLALLASNETTKCVVELKGDGANGLVNADVARADGARRMVAQGAHDTAVFQRGQLGEHVPMLGPRAERLQRVEFAQADHAACSRRRERPLSGHLLSLSRRASAGQDRLRVRLAGDAVRRGHERLRFRAPDQRRAKGRAGLDSLGQTRFDDRHLQSAGRRRPHVWLGKSGIPEGVEAVDADIGRVLATYEEAGLLAETFVVFTSDHGGIEKKHGGTTLDEMERPVFFAGPGVKRGYEIPWVTLSSDVGATIAHVLGVRPARAWTGRAIDDIFESCEAKAK